MKSETSRMGYLDQVEWMVRFYFVTSDEFTYKLNKLSLVTKPSAARVTSTRLGLPQNEHNIQVKLNRLTVLRLFQKR